MKKLNFIIYSERGELLGLAMYLQIVERQNVLMRILDENYASVGDGIINKIPSVTEYIGKGYTWIMDSNAKVQDLLREKGEAVFGSSNLIEKMKEDYRATQSWFKEAGFQEPFSQNFKTLSEATDFVKTHTAQRWVVRPYNFIGQFDGSQDVIEFLEELSKKVKDPVGIDLVEYVEGLEVIATGFFYGRSFTRDKTGKVIGFLNFEDKGGSTFIGVNDSNKIFESILLRPQISKLLQKSGFRGAFGIKCIKTKDGIVALSCRDKVTPYELVEGLNSPTSDLLEAVARGMGTPIDVKKNVGMSLIVKSGAEKGEKVWILSDRTPIHGFSLDQVKHIQFSNLKKVIDDDTNLASYRVALNADKAFTASASGTDISEVREYLTQYIKSNISLPDMDFRNDVGKRVEEQVGFVDKTKREKISVETQKQKLNEELAKIKIMKDHVKKMLYE